MKTIIYVRVSSKEQEETGYSLDAQEKLLTEYAEQKGLSVVKIFRVSESASSDKIRRVFSEMMSLLEKEDIHVLICEKTDRLTRKRKDAVIIDEWVKKYKDNEVHFVKENFILTRDSRANEKFIWGIKVEVAQYYTNNLSEEVKKGQEEKIRQGWLPAKPLLGYKTVGEKGHKIHVIDDKESPLIKKLFELYGSGEYSLKSLTDKIYIEGLRSRTGSKLSKSRIHTLLGNPFYYGCIRWKDLISKGRHEPLISQELFEKVQAILHGKNTPHHNRHKFQFRKMIKCGECGGTITAEIKKGKYTYYHCNGYKNCSQNKYTLEETLEKQLLGVFRFFESITTEEAEKIRSDIKADHKAEIEYKEKTIKILMDRFKKLQRRLDVLYDDRLDEKITSEMWERKRGEITKEQEQLQLQITKLKSEEAQYFEIWLNILDLACRAREIYEKRSPEERRLLLVHIFQNLTLKDQKVAYTLKKPVEVLAKRVQEKLDAKKTLEPKKALGKQELSNGLVSKTDALLRGQDSNL